MPYKYRVLMVHALAFLWVMPCNAENADIKLANNKTHSTYRLSPLDAISITVFNEPNLSTPSDKSQRIDADGFIHVALLGDVKILELTARETEKLLEDLFVKKRLLRSPQVSIFVTSYFPKQVSVLGQVNNPGLVDFDDEANTMNIAKIIALAGGFKDIAKSSGVQVTRPKDNGEQEIFIVDVDDIIQGSSSKKKNDQVEHFKIYSNDIIFVPQRIF